MMRTRRWPTGCVTGLLTGVIALSGCMSDASPLRASGSPGRRGRTWKRYGGWPRTAAVAVELAAAGIVRRRHPTG